MAASDSSSNPPVAEVIEGLKQAEAALAEILGKNRPPVEA